MSPTPAPEITIADREVGLNHPTYFIADIAANHDGDLDRAIELIRLAAEAVGLVQFPPPDMLPEIDEEEE